MPRSSTSRWWRWVQRNLDARSWTNADLARAIRERGGSVDESVIGRWKNRGATPSPDSVRLVAKVFGRNIREAIIASELFTARELNAELLDPANTDLTRVPDELLIDELRQRIAARHEQAQHEQPSPASKRRARKPAASRTATTVRTGSGHSTTIPLDGQTNNPPPSEEDEGSSEARAETRS
jgi:transcriptional regulator with XRE-family HTH domain